MTVALGSSLSVRTRQRRRAAMLLEIVLALTLLFISMAIIGIQINTSVNLGYRSERKTQALMLAEAKLAQLDTGVITLDREIDGDFGKSFPGYFWRFYFEEDEDVENLWDVKLEILYGPYESDLEPGDIDDATVITTLHTMRPTPATLNLQRDFGLTEEKLAEISEDLPIGIIDPTDINPAMFAEMEIEDLMDIMPMLIETFGLGFGFSQSQIESAINMGLIDPSNLPTGASDALKDFGGGRGGGGAGRGGEDRR